MVARVTGVELKEIVDTDKADSLLESQFINTAHIFVEANLVDSGLSEDVLKVIELYLAAHFLIMTEERGGLIVEHFGDATNRYADVFKDGGLYMTRFGQQAITFDTTGTLAKLKPKQRAEFRVI